MRKLLVLLLLLFSQAGLAQLDSALIDNWSFGSSLANGVQGGNTAKFTFCGDSTAPTYVNDRFNTTGCALKVSKCGGVKLPMLEGDLLGDYTFSFWFKPFYSANSFLTASYTMLNFSSDGNLTTGGKLYATNSSHNFDATVYDKWYHVVLVLRSSSHGTLYVENSLVDSNFFYVVPSPFVGRNLQTESGMEALDDFRVYKRAITRAEITQLYQLSSSCGIVTDIENEPVMKKDAQKVVGAVDFLGKPISDINAHTGPMIVLYSDGSRKKIIKQTPNE